MLKEFRNFVMRGNVLDLAVAVIMAIAFGAVVTSLVNDIIMPPIGAALGGVDFSDLFITLSDGDYDSLAAAQEAGAATLNYGQFLNVVINFLIVAFAVFLIIKAVDRAMKLRRVEEPVTTPVIKECPYCLSEIPIKATRCAHCTSQLEEGKAA